MSKFASVGKQFLKKCDLFASMQFLRFKSDAETKTLTGGFLSLAVVVFLFTQFTTMIFDTFSKTIIKSVRNSIQEETPPTLVYSTEENGKSFMLGFSLKDHDLTTGLRYFDIQASNTVKRRSQTTNETILIQLQPCTRNHWSGIENMNSMFDRIGVAKWLCLPVNQTYTVSGSKITSIQRSLRITVSRCNNATQPSRPCATPAQIDSFLRNNSQLYWLPFFMNPLLNPEQQNYLSYYVQNKWYVMSGFNRGSQLYIYSDDYQITTDQSIFPIEQLRLETGPIVNSVKANAYDLDNSSDIFCMISFSRAPGSIIINRTFEKVLDAFAYVGGLLGSFMLLLLFITFYNEGSFQLNFASALYMPQEGSPNTFRGYNLFFYIIQGIYTVFRVFGIKLHWKSTTFFYQTRKEMLKQLDVMFLFKKIHILQSGMKLILTKPQLRGLMLQHEQNVTQARFLRKQYGIKLDVARLCKHKLERQKEKEPQLQKHSSSQIQMNQALRKRFPRSQNQIIIYDPKDMSQQSIKQEEFQINLQEFGSDSQSSGAEEEHLRKEQELQEDLLELQADCVEHNEISMKIFENIDPRIKKLLQKATDIKFHHKQTLTKMRRGLSRKETLDMLSPTRKKKQLPQLNELKEEEEEDHKKEENKKEKGDGFVYDFQEI